MQEAIGNMIGHVFLKILFFLFKIYFFKFLDYFDVLILKINFKKLKKYYLYAFLRKKNTLKNNRYHNIKINSSLKNNLIQNWALLLSFG